jgi:hypothetical protein
LVSLPIFVGQNFKLLFKQRFTTFVASLSWKVLTSHGMFLPELSAELADSSAVTLLLAVVLCCKLLSCSAFKHFFLSML